MTPNLKNMMHVTVVVRFGPLVLGKELAEEDGKSVLAS